MQSDCKSLMKQDLFSYSRDLIAAQEKGQAFTDRVARYLATVYHTQTDVFNCEEAFSGRESSG